MMAILVVIQAIHTQLERNYFLWLDPCCRIQLLLLLMLMLNLQPINQGSPIKQPYHEAGDEKNVVLAWLYSMQLFGRIIFLLDGSLNDGWSFKLEKLFFPLARSEFSQSLSLSYQSMCYSYW